MKAEVRKFQGRPYKIELVAESVDDEITLNDLYRAVSGRKELVRFAGATADPAAGKVSKLELSVSEGQ